MDFMLLLRRLLVLAGSDDGLGLGQNLGDFSGPLLIRIRGVKKPLVRAPSERAILAFRSKSTPLVGQVGRRCNVRPQ